MSGYIAKQLKPGYRGKFVIQDHKSSKHHFDFRLEFPVKSLQKSLSSLIKQVSSFEEAKKEIDKIPDKEGSVLRSWAIPRHKFPSKKGEKLLMVETSDHGMSYRLYEGELEPGSYGAQSESEPGIVKVWDEGDFEILDVDYDKKYVIKLHGNKDKVSGLYSLVKTKNGSWLILKMDTSREQEYRDKMREKTSNILDYPQQGLDLDIWNPDQSLQDSVRDQVQNKLFSFLIGQGFTNFDDWILDIMILGSLTSYQYTRKSDLDAHVIVDPEEFINLELSKDLKINSEEVIEIMNDVWRSALNDQEKELLFNTSHPIEFYFEQSKDMTQRINRSDQHDGIYSTFTDKWLLPPRTVDFDFDPEEVFKDIFIEAEEIAKDFDLQIGVIYRSLKDVDLLLESISTFSPEYKIIFAERLKQKLDQVEKEIEDLVEKGVEIKEKRQENYEMTSPQNIIFKYLARYGYLYVYRELKKLLENDDQITIDEVEKAKKILQDAVISSRIVSRYQYLKKQFTEGY